MASVRHWVLVSWIGANDLISKNRDNAFKAEFKMSSLEGEINSLRQMVIVSAELDASTEYISIT